MRVVRAPMAAAICAVLVLVSVGLSLVGANAAAASEAEVVSPIKVDNFRLTDQNLQSHELWRLAGAPAVVIVTQENGCPVSRNIGSTLKALQAKYADKGVEFMMLNSNPNDTREDIQAEAKAYGYDMPILMDSNQLVGEQLGVTRTAEVFVIDPKTWRIAYRGPVDDRVTYERQKAKADHTWAKDALDSLLAGKPVAVAQEPAVGCLIDFPQRDRVAARKVS